MHQNQAHISGAQEGSGIALKLPVLASRRPAEKDIPVPRGPSRHPVRAAGGPFWGLAEGVLRGLRAAAGFMLPA